MRVPSAEREAAIARLLDLAPGGFEEIDDGGEVELAAYVDPAVEAAIREAFPDAVVSDVEPGWEDRWREFHRPVWAGGVWLGPPWETPPVDAPSVVIDPGRAFGTGAHPTTRLCVELLARCERGPDLGAGRSGERVVAPVIEVRVRSVVLVEDVDHRDPARPRLLEPPLKLRNHVPRPGHLEDAAGDEVVVDHVDDQESGLRCTRLEGAQQPGTQRGVWRDRRIGQRKEGQDPLERDHFLGLLLRKSGQKKSRHALGSASECQLEQLGPRLLVHLPGILRPSGPVGRMERFPEKIFREKSATMAPHSGHPHLPLQRGQARHRR